MYCLHNNFIKKQYKPQLSEEHRLAQKVAFVCVTVPRVQESIPISPFALGGCPFF